MNADEVQLKFDGMGISFLRQSSDSARQSPHCLLGQLLEVQVPMNASNIMDRFYCCNHAKVPGPVADVLLTCGSPGERTANPERPIYF